MRILHVIGTLDPAYGGPPAVALRLAAAQAGFGHEVGFLTYRSPPGQAALAEARRIVPDLPSVDMHFLPPPSWAGRLRAGDAHRRAAALLGGYELAHIHTLWPPIVPAVAAAARRRAVPYVIRPAGALDPWSLGQRRWKKRLALALGYRRMLDRAAFLHVLNPDEQRLVRPLGLRCPTVVIPNGVSFQELEPLPPPGEFRARRPELGEGPFVLFLGRLHYKKGLDQLALAFAEVAEAVRTAHLVVAGPDEGARDRFAAQVRGLGLQERVHLVGPLYGRAKRAALVDAACFCLPSRQEGFSMAVTEALACGVPVVISEYCHFPEVAEAGAGAVLPLEPDAFAAALLGMLEDPGRAKEMGRRGRALVQAKFTWTVIAKASVEAYERTGIERAS